jgi:hypothetical protein
MGESIINMDRVAAKDPAIDGNELSLPLPQLIVLGQAETELVRGGALPGGSTGGPPQPYKPVHCLACGMQGPIPLPGL